MAMQDDDEAIEALRFPKVTARMGFDEFSGHLTETSARLLLVELDRRGFVLRQKVR